jgi:hypothetical protein
VCQTAGSRVGRGYRGTTTSRILNRF